MSHVFSVSLVLIAYNQEAFIKEACESAINQDCQPIEIILSDDCSTDNTFEIMQQVVQAYRGHHRLRLNQNSKNLGLIEHINHVVELSSGDVIVYAAGDDVSLPNRVSRTVELFASNGFAPLLVHSSVQEISEKGDKLEVVTPPAFHKKYSCEKMAQKYSLVIGATCAWHRSVWQKFGYLAYPQAYEDAVMAFRACVMGGTKAFVYSDQPLIEYRVSAKALSQGGRSKPKDRLHRQQFELKRLKTRIDICNQRLDDVRSFGANRLIHILEREKQHNEMTRWVYEKKINFVPLLSLAIKHHAIMPFLVAMIKRWRVM